jgi:hypothetical protein
MSFFKGMFSKGNSKEYENIASRSDQRRSYGTSDQVAVKLDQYHKDKQDDDDAQRCCYGKLIKRNWWKYSLAAVLLLAVLGYILYQCAFIPYIDKLAQQKLEATHIKMDKIVLSNPNSNSLRFTGSGKMEGNSDIPVTKLDGTRFAVMWKGNHLGYLNMAGTQINGLGVDFVMDGRLEIDQDSLFSMFLRSAVSNHSASLQLVGSSEVQVDVLGTFFSIPVEFNERVTLLGCGGLQGAIVTRFKMQTIFESSATISMYNPSNMSLEHIGNLTLDVHFLGVYLGFAIVPDASIISGQNELNASMSLIPSSSNNAALQELFSSYLGNNASTLSLRINSVDRNESLWSALLSGVSFEVELPGAASFQ